MRPADGRRWFALAGALALGWTLAACAALQPAAPPAAEAAAAVRAEAAGGVALQARRDWSFPADGLRFDNRLPAARLGDVARIAPGHYRVHVEPEVQPVNPSPWYGFRVAADQARTIRVEFSYPEGHRHRYTPKLKFGEAGWREATAREFAIDAGGNAHLQLELGPGSVLVFAQPPLLPDDVAAWTDRLAQQLPLQREVFGYSRAGHPLELFAFGRRDAPIVLVVGRQHPPENTGHLALMHFVQALAADTPLARGFRARHRVVVAPMLNPDGVLEGHWRTNLAGTDLNRDWGPFAQPETRALRDALRAPGDAQGIVFAIDFHSTYRDVFYTVAEDPSRETGGVLHDWMQAMRERYPGRIEEKAYAATSTVFKNWAYCRFGTPAVTYEVGDATPAWTLRDVAGHAAESLMRRLLARPTERPAPGRCPATAAAG